MATANAGRTPEPPALKLLKGRGPGRDSGGRKVTEPPPFVRLPPECPEFLTGEARAEWERVVPELQRLKLTKTVDRASLTAYCLAWQRLCDGQAELAAAGSLTYQGKQGHVRHPAVGLVESASKELRAWAAEFGFTPSAEAKVGKPEASDGNSDNPFGVAAQP